MTSIARALKDIVKIIISYFGLEEKVTNKLSEALFITVLFYGKLSPNIRLGA